MVKPQTARRRQRVQQQQIHQHQHQHQQQTTPVDDIGGMHDEADIMSFRSAATQRFLLNQELIENLTEKWIHVDKITKPLPFANVLHSNKTHARDIKGELYFGNIGLMKQKLELLNAEVDGLGESLKRVDEEFAQSKFLIDTVALMGESYDRQTSINTAEVEEQVKQRLSKKVVEGGYKVREIPSLRNDLSEAPLTYWDDLKRARERARATEQQQQQQQPSPQQQVVRASTSQAKAPDSDIIMGNTSFGNAGQDQIVGGYDANVFGSTGLEMMDENNFGLQSTLDDQDFLSQMDHSME